MPRISKGLKKKPLKKIYKINNVCYESKTLYDFHVECDKAQKIKLIKSYEIPHNTGKKSRFSTYKPIINGIKFDSLMEAKYYIYLLNLKYMKIIKDFEMQISFNLQPAFTKNKKKYRPIDYVCDFIVYYPNKTEVVDIKGRETVEFKLKHKMFEYKYPDYELKLLQYYEPDNTWLELSEIRKLTRKKKITK